MAYATQLDNGQTVNLIGNLQINEWNGNQTPQFIVQDIAMDTMQILDYRSKSKNTNFLNNDQSTAFVIHSKVHKSNDNEFYYGEVIPVEYDKIVFRDLPNTLDELKVHYNKHKYLKFILYFNIKCLFILKVCQVSVYLNNVIKH